MTQLHEEPLLVCRKHSVPLSHEQLKPLLARVPEWHVISLSGITQLQRSFACHDFTSALTLADAIGELANTADHHPALTVEWGKLTVRWWTHVIGGLHRNDFIMAARCDQLLL